MPPSTKIEDTHHDAFLRLGGRYCWAVPDRVVHLFPASLADGDAKINSEDPFGKVRAICSAKAYRSHLRNLDDESLDYLRTRKHRFCQNCMRTGVRE